MLTSFSVSSCLCRRCQFCLHVCFACFDTVLPVCHSPPSFRWLTVVLSVWFFFCSLSFSLTLVQSHAQLLFSNLCLSMLWFVQSVRWDGSPVVFRCGLQAKSNSRSTEKFLFEAVQLESSWWNCFIVIPGWNISTVVVVVTMLVISISLLAIISFPVSCVKFPYTCIMIWLLLTSIVTTAAI